MTDPKLTPSFPSLLQRFFVEHLGNQRAVSSRTIAAYRDTFRLLDFAEATIGKASTRLTLVDLDAQLILSFLDHLEKERSNGVRTRNARLAAGYHRHAAGHSQDESGRSARLAYPDPQAHRRSPNGWPNSEIDALMPWTTRAERPEVPAYGGYVEAAAHDGVKYLLTIK